MNGLDDDFMGLGCAFIIAVFGAGLFVALILAIIVLR